MTPSGSADAPRASVAQILAEYTDLQLKLADPACTPIRALPAGWAVGMPN